MKNRIFHGEENSWGLSFNFISGSSNLCLLVQSSWFPELLRTGVLSQCKFVREKLCTAGLERALEKVAT